MRGAPFWIDALACPAMRKACILVVVFLVALVACSSAEKGESCEDEGKINGDCGSGLMCARKKADDTSELVCLVPCEGDTNCAANESCSGDRGRNLKACRAR
jgi:hypothetical protein